MCLSAAQAAGPIVTGRPEYREPTLEAAQAERKALTGPKADPTQLAPTTKWVVLHSENDALLRKRKGAPWTSVEEMEDLVRQFLKNQGQSPDIKIRILRPADYRAVYGSMGNLEPEKSAMSVLTWVNSNREIVSQVLNINQDYWMHANMLSNSNAASMFYYSLLHEIEHMKRSPSRLLTRLPDLMPEFKSLSESDQQMINQLFRKALSSIEEVRADSEAKKIYEKLFGGKPCMDMQRGIRRYMNDNLKNYEKAMAAIPEMYRDRLRELLPFPQDLLNEIKGRANQRLGPDRPEDLLLLTPALPQVIQPG